MISVYKPKLRTDEILKDLRPVLDSGWVGLGPKVKEFEKKLEEYLGVDHVIATNSCTSALHLALKVLPEKSNATKVITTPITFVSTNHAILYEKYTPVFADVDKMTGNIDPHSVEKLINAHGANSIKGIIVVHLGGYPVDLDAFNQISIKYDIPIIEDCAHAFGSYYKGKKIGNSNNICCWSFQAVKNLPVGDGGAISTNNPDLNRRLRKLRWLGIDADTVTRSEGGYKWEYMVTDVGYKYHMNDITATIGCVQIGHINEDNNRRSEIASSYNKLINQDSKIKVSMPDYDKDRNSSYWFYPIFFENREDVYSFLTKHEIYPSMHFRSNLRYPMFKDCETDNGCPNARWYEENVLSLPIHLHLSDDDVQKIITHVNEAINT